jgi:hypothetical protein
LPPRELIDRRQFFQLNPGLIGCSTDDSVLHQQAPQPALVMAWTDLPVNANADGVQQLIERGNQGGVQRIAVTQGGQISQLVNE